MAKQIISENSFLYIFLQEQKKLLEMKEKQNYFSNNSFNFQSFIVAQDDPEKVLFQNKNLIFFSKEGKSKKGFLNRLTREGGEEKKLL